MYPNRRKVVTTRIEHPAVLTTCRDLERHGYSVVEARLKEFVSDDLSVEEVKD